MKAFIFHSSNDLIEIISMDQNPIHIINAVKANHYEVCREINTMRIESLTSNHYIELMDRHSGHQPLTSSKIELHKTKRFFIYS